MVKAVIAEPDDLEAELIENAYLIANEGRAGWADKEWTRQVISRFAERGQARGFSICASGQQFGRGEWLYDLVWLKRDAEHPKHILDIPLILESEWNKFDSIVEDFEKLIIGRARHRVLVFQDRSSSKVTEIIRRLITIAASSTLTEAGDRYLFLGLDYTQTVFIPEVWVFA